MTQKSDAAPQEMPAEGPGVPQDATQPGRVSDDMHQSIVNLAAGLLPHFVQTLLPPTIRPVTDKFQQQKVIDPRTGQAGYQPKVVGIDCGFASSPFSGIAIRQALLVSAQFHGYASQCYEAGVIPGALPCGALTVAVEADAADQAERPEGVGSKD